MDSIFKRFFSFEKLIATGLIKFIYWVGIIGIGLFVIAAIFGGFSQGFGPGMGSLFGAPLIGAVSLLFWRFICEIYLVIFGIYDRLGNIQTAVGGGPAQDINSISDIKPETPASN